MVENFQMNNLQELNELQQNLGYAYKDQELLIMALTHSSFANERQLEHNERVEFLGDAVLELCISHILFLKFPSSTEGQLTRLRAALVSEASLARVARTLSLGKYIFLGKGEEQQGGRDRDAVLADTLEAILGSIFIDSGYYQAYECIFALFAGELPESADVLPASKDYKSRLQESTQHLFKARPVYTLVDSFGPEHEKRYLIQVELPDGSCIQAQAGSVKKAEQAAAGRALKYLDRMLKNRS